MAKKTNYFSHDSNARNDTKMLRMRKQLGSAAYGVYFMLIEILREEDGYVGPLDYETLKYDVREDVELIRAVVEDYGLFEIIPPTEPTEMGRFYSKSLLGRMKKVEVRRAAGLKGGRPKANKKQNESKTESKNDENKKQNEKQNESKNDGNGINLFSPMENHIKERKQTKDLFPTTKEKEGLMEESQPVGREPGMPADGFKDSRGEYKVWTEMLYADEAVRERLRNQEALSDREIGMYLVVFERNTEGRYRNKHWQGGYEDFLGYFWNWFAKWNSNDIERLFDKIQKEKQRQRNEDIWERERQEREARDAESKRKHAEMLEAIERGEAKWPWENLKNINPPMERL